MDVRELRVGNWTDNNVELLQITKKDLAFLLTDDNEHYANPVKITEWWLYKFGFINDEPYSILNINGFELLYYQYKLDERNQFRFSMCDREIKIEYVHQLQNFYYYITGEELPYA